MKKWIIAFNAGSSSLKWKVFLLPSLRCVDEGRIEGVGLVRGRICLPKKNIALAIHDHIEAFRFARNHLKLEHGAVEAVVHRVVHGGQKFVRPQTITPSVLAGIEKLSELAPLHNPPNVQGIRSGFSFFPQAKHVAVFDTGFFHDLPEAVARYALPSVYYSKYHIRRYGFHGISHEYVASEAAKRLRKPLSKLNLVTCHLGAGSSMAVLANGKPIDTTMGFTPVEGLTMGTRVGDLDPMVPLYLMKRLGMSIEGVEQLLTRQSGLLGISGFSSDMREILLAAGIRVAGFASSLKANPTHRKKARLALEIFIYDARRYLASYLGLLPRVDAIVFTGGIGSANATIRRMLLRGLRLPTKTSVLAIPSNEELAMARCALPLIKIL